MIEIIKNRILDKIWHVFADGCDFCLEKTRHYLFEDSDYTKAKFWNEFGKWFNKMEYKIYYIRYGKAQ